MAVPSNAGGLLVSRLKDSEALEQVINLHRPESGSLGFFPRGAFEDYAAKRQILVAECENRIYGYALFRIAKGRATLVHLCTDRESRGGGIAKVLVEELKRVTKHLAGISLRCRQDNQAKPLWPKLGFTALGRVPGRGKDGHELTEWWFDHQHPDLFSLIKTADERNRVVIDANIFFDLQGRENVETVDSLALQADWLEGIIELCVTKELRNEIDRCTDNASRKASLGFASRFTVLEADDAIFQQARTTLKPIIPEEGSARNGSDLRQVAYAIAGNASFFVTRDRRLIERCDNLYETFGLHVLYPAELISRLDVIEREEAYRPAWLHGTRLQTNPMLADRVDEMADVFADHGEKRSDFRRELRHCLARPRECESQIFSGEDGKSVVLAIVDRGKDACLHVPVLRVATHPMSGTLVRSFLRNLMDAATAEGRVLLQISDASINGAARKALPEFGFFDVEGTWFKITTRSVDGVATLRSATDRCRELGMTEKAVSRADAAIQQVLESECGAAAAGAESLFWPAKLNTNALPSFIVPIRPEWAQHFFDVELSSQLLFGLRNELHLGIEGVYFRSANNSVLSAPGRILWYVSKGAGRGSMTIKACSRLDGVEVGKAEELFRRYRRLGVYSKRDIAETVDGDLEKPMMALRFSMTERFVQSVDLAQLERLGIRGPFMSPREVLSEQFASIYRSGFSLAHAN